MELAPGTIMCRKTTGELCIIIGQSPNEGEIRNGYIRVRRPVMLQDKGISHEAEYVFTYELETVEEHLRREAKEMLLKITIQEEMTEAMDNAKKGKLDKMLVN